MTSNGENRPRSKCKPCHNKSVREWRAANREKKRQQNLRYVGKLGYVKRGDEKVIEERKEKIRDAQKRLRLRKQKVYGLYRDIFEEEHPDNGIVYYAERLNTVYRLYKKRYEKEIGELE